ncbi:hypothetical protein [Priestia taiwanensis]|uniref:Uncharacterized protein n=1 Tax=Priestia taiwanensis TaxID=1347902 RepID=A0A917ANB0_9BACI|nr:hypothetical protein [Priestia taiwanensis]MBM7362145.1 hypothetical protein [Priestia taiwanensis]GGE59796.1 hypothetical protein GCM10007140_07680 [Priestia taiwanensis]
MNKALILFFIFVIFNTVRYLLYIVEGSQSLYYTGMFLIHLIAIMAIIMHFYSNKKTEHTS